jgi:hypothetical protein
MKCSLCFPLVVVAVACALMGCGANEEMDLVTSESAMRGTAGGDRLVCPGFVPGKKNPYFGDLHAHSSFSLDVYAFGVRNGPWKAYRFAKGDPVQLVNGSTKQLRAPLDFAAVTDHAETIGMMNLCTYPQYRNDRACRTFRYLSNQHPDGSNPAFKFMGSLALVPPRYPVQCRGRVPACRAGEQDSWRLLRQATQEANDPCRFSAFNGYEWTRTLGEDNNGHNHRNIIFANDDVPDMPIDAVRYNSLRKMWTAIEDECTSTGTCDALAIPHNPNLSRGWSFHTAWSTPEWMETRAKFERVVEMFQGKGNSECLNPGLHSATPDPGCTFENKYAGTIDTQAAWNKQRRAYARSALNRGLRNYVEFGVNPLVFGFIGSTDTHNGTPGATDEDTHRGHHGWGDLWIVKRQRGQRTRNNPGGLAGVWAEQNTRADIFAALKRRETFATSGTRLAVRFFQTWSPTNQCRLWIPEVDAAMGSRMLSLNQTPRFVVQAWMDRTPIERVDIIKGSYVDGQVVEQIFSFEANDPQNGDAFLCHTWEDEDYDPSVPTYWYARVLEKPTWRYSKHDCENKGNCAEVPPRLNRSIRERAWASPIWNLP